MKSWDYDYLITKRNKLINRYCISRSKNERYTIANMIGSIDSALEYLEQDYSVNTDAEDNILDSIIQDTHYYHKYKDYIPDINDFFTGFYFNMPEQPTSFQRIETKKSKILTMTKDLYLDVKPIYYERLLNRERTSNLRLRFERSKHNTQYEGITFPIYSTDTTLVSSNINKHIGDYFNLIHEFGHVLNHSYYRYQIFDENKYALQEVAPLFFELVGGDYLIKQGLDNREINKLFVHMFRDAVSGAGVDTYRMDLIRNRKRFEEDQEVVDYLERNFEDQALIDFSIANVISENMHYVFSYMVAVELYQLYLVNKEEALCRLNKIMKVSGLKPSEYYEYIRDLGIKPLDSMTEYVTDIKEKQKSYGK